MKQQSKLGRTGSHRKAMFRSLVTALFRNDRIRTTQIKAREVRPIAEKLITLAKRGDLHARRQAAGMLLDAEVLQKLFSDIGPRYQDRQGGYTRIVKLGQRRGDFAQRQCSSWSEPSVQSLMLIEECAGGALFRLDLWLCAGGRCSVDCIHQWDRSC